MVVKLYGAVDVVLLVSNDVHVGSAEGLTEVVLGTGESVVFGSLSMCGKQLSKSFSNKRWS